MIKSLQSLRGIFAIMIFLSHFNITGDGERAFYPGGTMGVEFFIMLSGFVMCAGYENIVEADRISYKDFMLKRLIRLYPLHLLCLLLWFIIYDAQTGTLGLLTNIAMLQAWVPEIEVYYGCNTPSWCLGVFMFLYAVFPALIALVYRHPKAAKRCLLSLIAVFTVYIICYPVNSFDEVWATRIFPPTRLVDFSIGIALWQIYRRASDHRATAKLRSASTGVKTAVELSVIALYAVASICAGHLSAKWCSELVWWIPTVSAISVFSLFDRSGGLISKMLNTRPLVAFGNASFCFYLLHLPVIAAIYRFTNHFGLTQSRFTMLWITLAAAIIASFVVNRFYDKPVTAFLRKRLL